MAPSAAISEPRHVAHIPEIGPRSPDLAFLGAVVNAPRRRMSAFFGIGGVRPNGAVNDGVRASIMIDLTPFVELGSAVRIVGDVGGVVLCTEAHGDIFPIALVLVL